MSPELIKARNKQITRGNTPQQTELTPEQWDDFLGFHPSGLYYRRALNEKLKSQGRLPNGN